ncbi:unnamed protein product [Larinioides sclopetarius]|uniref:Uncharacterized protein n=1 Tax=Larinioides sclopetarius TaxID=280406 RepID=A0AAV2AYD2_9ARAC
MVANVGSAAQILTHKISELSSIISFTFEIPIPPAKLISTERKITVEAVIPMASIPFASYSASKIHDHVRAKQKFDESQYGESDTKIFHHNAFGVEKMLQNYNNKLMNSIWGQYNLYAAHAFQKNNEGAHPIADIFNIPQVKNLWEFRTAH